MMRRQDVPEQKNLQKSFSLKWLSVNFIIDVYRADDKKTNLCWIWKEEGPEIYELTAVVPLVSAKPIVSAGQLVQSLVLSKLRRFHG